MSFRTGQVYQALRDVPVTCMTAWASPCTLGYERVFPAQEQFKIDCNPPAQATALYVVPLNYTQLHKDFVSWKDRWHPLYRGYYLCISMETVESNCSLLRESEA